MARQILMSQMTPEAWRVKGQEARSVCLSLLYLRGSEALPHPQSATRAGKQGGEERGGRVVGGALVLKIKTRLYLC